MKKFFSGLILLMCAVSLFAQDCPICGDWGGVYTDGDGKNVKAVINIKANGDEYIIRLKQVYCNGVVKYDDFTGYTFRVAYSNSDSTLIRWVKLDRVINQRGRNADGDEYDKTDVYRRHSLKINGEKMIFKMWDGFDRMYESSYEPGLYERLCVDVENMITCTLIKGDEVTSFSEICQSEKMLSNKDMGQDCSICGDWHGVYFSGYSNGSTIQPGNVKVTIRIIKSGDGYAVREKKIYPGGEVVEYSDFEDYTFNTKYSDSDSTLILWRRLLSVEYKEGADRYCGAYDRTDRYYYYGIKIKGSKMMYGSGPITDRFREFDDRYYRVCSDDSYFDWSVTLYKDDEDW